MNRLTIVLNKRFTAPCRKKEETAWVNRHTLSRGDDEIYVYEAGRMTITTK